MATSSELIECMAVTLGMNESTCANTYKELRAGDLVTNKGRGRNAASMTVHDAVMLLFAVCGSEHVKDSVDAARRYSGLRAKYRDGGSQDHEREPEDAAWYVISDAFPYLGMLKPRHTLLEATAALISSYSDNAIVAVSKQFAPLVKLSVRGPTPSAAIAVSMSVGTEELSYATANARDMFRSVIDENPVRQRKKMLRGQGDLKIEKHISHTTLEILGELLRT